MLPTLPVWTDELSVGNALVDLQHQKLITLCNKAYVCLDDGSPEATRKFHALLNDLATLATEHFRTEEVLLEQNNYPSLAAHMAEHDGHIESITNLLYAATKGLVDIAGAAKASSEWLISHVLNTDLSCKAYFKAI